MGKRFFFWNFRIVFVVEYVGNLHRNAFLVFKSGIERGEQLTCGTCLLLIEFCIDLVCFLFCIFL